MRELASRNLEEWISYNFEGYLWNWHHKVLVKKLQEVAEGKCKRLVVCMPPRRGKSEICSIQFPAWYLGRNPRESIIATSYGSDLALDFGRQTRNIINDVKFRNVFPEVRLAEDSQAKGKWTTNYGGNYFAVGVGGALTGRGAKILLIDDPIKNRQDADSMLVRDNIWSWYRSTARTRLAPDGAIVIVLTRWHNDDIVGRLLEGATGKSWEMIKIKEIAETDEPPHRRRGDVLWPDRFSLESILETKAELGSFEFSALYQQEPVDNENQEFKKDWFSYVTMDDVIKQSMRCFITVDTALSLRQSSDYTAFTINFVNSENKWHIISQKVKINSAALIDRLFVLYDKYKPEKIGIEKTAFTDAIYPFLKDEMRKRKKDLPVIELSHNNNKKELRIRGLVPKYENRDIFHIDDTCADLEAELLSFPKGIHDDAADSLAYQLQIAEKLYDYRESDYASGDSGFDRFSLF